jgi:hypothetical protein
VKNPPDHITVKAGKTGWIGLRIIIPENARPGTVFLNATLQSGTQAAVRESFHVGFSVRAGKKEKTAAP